MWAIEMKHGFSVRFAAVACWMGALVMLAGPLPAGAATAQRPPSGQRWVATWAQAMTSNFAVVGPRPTASDVQPVERAPALRDATLRQAVVVSAGGSTIRIRLSNYFGREPLVVSSARVALPASGEAGFDASATATRPVAFEGRPSVVIQPGSTVTSDPISLHVPPLSRVLVSLYFGGTAHLADVHPMEHATTAFAVRGDATGQGSLAGSRDLLAALGMGAVSHIYVLDEIDVLAPVRARGIVAFGDSITDGAYATAPDKTWPGVFAGLADGPDGPGSVGVVNMAISGNELTVDQRGNTAFGVSGLKRFERDVIDVAGTTDVVVLLGANDLNRGTDPAGYPRGASFGAITNAYRMLADVAHEHRIRIYIGTVTPFAGFPDPGWYSPAKESTRERVNRWIRTSGIFDGVIDFSRALAGPYTPSPLAAEQHPLPPGLANACRGDRGLHPNDRGYAVMGTLAFDKVLHGAAKVSNACHR
ncbi:MAG TPA: GDSL-type esterase/lipase family protein [Rhodanobacteraceae bacterium]|nr:GDSL-type esterase/lipase family protein [Rhodanobacteraceae bacterium]